MKDSEHKIYYNTMSTLRSVDINAILMQQQFSNTLSNNEQTGLLNSSKTANELLANITSKHVLFSAKSWSKLTLNAICQLDAQELILLEEKNQKKRRFKINFTQKLILYNSRRAQNQELKYLAHQLKLKKKQLHQNSFIFLKGTKTSQDIPQFLEEPLNKLGKYLSHLSEPISQFSLTPSNQAVLDRLLTHCTDYFRPSKKASEKPFKQELITFFETLAKDFLSDETKVLVITKKKQSFSPQHYCIYIQIEKVVYIEKSDTSKREFVLQFKPPEVLLNDVEASDDELSWLLNKCKKVSLDISTNKAMVMEGEKA